MTDTETQTSTGLFDPNDPAHAKALDKLEHDLIAWFTTIAANGQPHSVPVWFLWHDGTLLVMSEPHTAKVKHVRAGSPVLMHLEGGEFGNDVVVLNGTAEISDRPAVDWLPELREVYSEKYAEAIADYGVPVEALFEKFSTMMVFRPAKLMAW